MQRPSAEDKMVSDIIAAQYYSLFIMWLVMAIIGAISVAAVDAARGDMGRPVPQH